MDRQKRPNPTWISFKRWSRKGYAAFVSLQKVIRIGNLSRSVSDKITKNHLFIQNMSFIKTVEEKILSGGDISWDEALLLSQIEDKTLLYAAADRIREHYFGKKMDLCSILNAKSGRCSEDCQWCSQSKYHTSTIQQYDLTERQTALQQAQRDSKAGVHRFSFVTSGRTISSSHLKKLTSYYREIRQENPRLHLCASMGLLDLEQMQELFAAGVSRYHCNLETAPSYFSTLCSTHTIEEKKQTLSAARKAGMELCSGGIIGMGESMAQRIELAFALKELKVLSIPINILNPIKGTKLENAAPLSEDEILTTIALFRFINPQAWIRFAGGRTLIQPIESQALQAGINGSIVGDMLTTHGYAIQEDVEHFKAQGWKC